jgi:hypothetical protein
MPTNLNKLGLLGAGLVGLVTVSAVGIGVLMSNAPKEHTINPPENPTLSAYGTAVLNGQKIPTSEIDNAMLTALQDANNVAVSNYAFQVAVFAQKEITENKESKCFRQNRTCVYDDMLKAIIPRAEAALRAKNPREIASLTMQVQGIHMAYQGNITPISPKPAVLGLVLSEYRQVTANRHNSATEVAAEQLAKAETKKEK